MLFQERFKGLGDEDRGNGERRESAKPCHLGFGIGVNDVKGAVGRYGMQCFQISNFTGRLSLCPGGPN